GDGVPGPDDVADSGPHDRRTAHRDPAPAPSDEPVPTSRPGRGTARMGWHPRTAQTIEAVPAQPVRRHAPAGRVRLGAGMFTATTDCRRADDGTGRDGATADPRPARAVAARAGHGDGSHHARPR